MLREEINRMFREGIREMVKQMKDKKPPIYEELNRLDDIKEKYK